MQDLPLGSINISTTVGDTMNSKTNTYHGIEANEDSLYTALNSQEEITSGLVFPNLTSSRQGTRPANPFQPRDGPRDSTAQRVAVTLQSDFHEQP